MIAIKEVDRGRDVIKLFKMPAECCADTVSILVPLSMEPRDFFACQGGQAALGLADPASGDDSREILGFPPEN